MKFPWFKKFINNTNGETNDNLLYNIILFPIAFSVASNSYSKKSMIYSRESAYQLALTVLADLFCTCMRSSKKRNVKQLISLSDILIMCSSLAIRNCCLSTHHLSA